MPTLDRPRFSLRSLMIFVVLVGVYLAGMFPTYQGFGKDSIVMDIGQGLHCGELAVFVFYRSLSRWIWVVIAADLFVPLDHSLGLGNLFSLQFRGNDALQPLFLIGNMVPALLNILGLVLIFRDIRRQL